MSTDTDGNLGDEMTNLCEVTANFSHTIGRGSPYVFGEQESPYGLSFGDEKFASVFVGRGFTFERLSIDLSRIVPTTTVHDYNANRHNVQDPATWRWGSLSKLSSYGGAGLVFMASIDNAPSWLTCDGSTAGVPNDWSVWRNIVAKVYAYLRVYPCIQFVELHAVGRSVAGSSYPSTMLAYHDIFTNTAEAIHSIDRDIPFGATMPAFPEGLTWIDSLLDPYWMSAAANVAFVSFPSYDEGEAHDESDITVLRAVATKHGRSDVPFFVNSWNFTDNVGISSMNNASSDAISYVGERLTQFIRAGVNGANLSSMSINSVNLRQKSSGIYSDLSFMPKVRSFFMMSKILGLGAGISVVVQSENIVGDILSPLAAINVFLQPVLCLTNNTTLSTSCTLNVIGLVPNNVYNMLIWEASVFDKTEQPREAITFTCDENGTYIFPPTPIPPKSVVGMVMTRVVTESSMPTPSRHNVSRGCNHRYR